MVGRRVAILVGLFVLLSAHQALAAEDQGLGAGDTYFTAQCRVMDTRISMGGPTLAAGEKRVLLLTGSCGPPSDALAVAINIVVVQPAAAGYAQLFAGDAPAPATSVLNFRAGQVRANNAIVALAGNGSGTIALVNGSSGAADYVIDISGYFKTGCPPITVSPAGPALPAGTSGTPYNQTFTASGGTGPYTFAVTSGALPANLNLASGGLLSGTPIVAGDFAFTVTATDTATGCTGSTAYTLHINCGTLTVVITPTPAQVCSGSAGNTANATAGFATYSWTITNGTIQGSTTGQSISYTAGASGNVGLTVNVTDVSACPGQGTKNVPINANPPPPSIATSNPQTFTVSGGAGTFTLTFNGQTTSSLAFNATAAQVQTALNALSSIGGVGGSVTVTQLGGVYTVTFGGTLTGPQPQMTATGAGGCTVLVSGPAVCAGSTGNQARGPAGATTYAWTIGNGTITSAANIQTITYTAGVSGIVTLNLTITNPGGCSASNSANVAINPSPATPTITPTPAQVCASSTGNTAAGPAGATTYAWTITNGTITSATNIQTITYTAGASGNVTLNLTVTNASGCAASNSANVPINANPALPTITPTPAQVCANSTGNQASGPAGATSYAWTATNGTITSATNIQTITYTAGASGVVTLSLTVTNAAGCAATNALDVLINALPATPSIATSNPQTFTVSGASGTFTLTFNGQTTTSLAFNATAAQVQSALNALSSIGGVGGSVVVAQGGGIYKVTFGGTLTGPQPLMTASGAGGCTIVVDPPAVCADSTGNQASGPAGATTYAWTIGNGTITSAANIQTITYTAGSSGTVTLNLTVTNPAACSASNSVIVTINANPATPTITPTPAQVCANSTGNTADGPAGAASYAWTITNGTITSATNIQTITYTAGASGNVTLNLTVTNASNCSASNSLDVTINPAPATPTITPTPAQVCAGSTGNQASGPAGATTYAWSITNGTITSATNIQTITYTAGVAAGNVGLTLTVTNAQGCSTSNTVNVTKNPNPTLTPGAGALPIGTYNTAYSQSFTPGGGTGPYTVVFQSGTLPHGITFSGNAISGTPIEPGGIATGNFSFTLRVTDTATSCFSDVAYTLYVQPKAVADACTGVGNTQLAGGVLASPPTTPFSTNCNGVLANDEGPGALTAAVSGAATNGTVTVNSNGTFLFTPNLNATTGGFNYTLTDGNGATATGTASLTFTGRVWYVNSTTGSDSALRGRSHEPLLTTAQAVTNASASDNIFVHFTGTNYAGASLSKDGLTLWGQGTTFTLGNLTITGTSKPTINSTLTIAGNNQTISSLDISTGAVTGITNTGTRTGLTTKNNIGVTTTTGTAVSFSNVDSTAGGAPTNGINFLSVSANGGANGIILTSVNVTNGTFTILGNGSAGTGGTIQHMFGADGAVAGSGVYLSNAKNISLSWMQLNDFQNFGVRGLNVTGFSLDKSVINGTNGTNSAGGSREGAIGFDGLFGSASITNSTVGGTGASDLSFSDNLRVTNTSGTLNRLTVTNANFGKIGVNGNDSLSMTASTGAVMNVTVTDSFFTNAIGSLGRIVVNNNSSSDVVFRRNKFSNNNPNAAGGAGNLSIVGDSAGTAATVTYDVSCNTFRDAIGIALLVAKGNGKGSFTGSIINNTVGVSGVSLSGSTQASGIKVTSNGTGTHTVMIANNVVLQTNEEGIFLQANDSMLGANGGGQGVMNATLFGNTVAEPGSFSFAGLNIDVGATSGDNNLVNVVVGSAGTAAQKNDFSTGDPANFSDVNFSQTFSTVINLSKNGSGSGTVAQVIDDDNLNPAATTTAVSGTVNLVGTLPSTPPAVATCTLPP